jgi:hypothetical protein
MSTENETFTYKYGIEFHITIVSYTGAKIFYAQISQLTALHVKKRIFLCFFLAYIIFFY